MKVKLIAILFFVCSHVLSQTHLIDSLRNLLKTDKTDTVKLQHLYDISWEFMAAGHYDSATTYANSLIALAEGFSLKEKNKSISNACYVLGGINYRTSNYPKALEYYFRALKSDQEIKNYYGMGKRLSMIGTIYFNSSDYTKALDFYRRALELPGQSDQYDILRNIGTVNMYQGNYLEALDNFFNALKIAENTGDKQSQSAIF